MQHNKHYNYDQLKENEKFLVDEISFGAFLKARQLEVPLAGNDFAEEAADALAKWVIASRKLTK